MGMDQINLMGFDQACECTRIAQGEELVPTRKAVGNDSIFASQFFQPASGEPHIDDVMAALRQLNTAPVKVKL
jgi:hypothetical protein